MKTIRIRRLTPEPETIQLGDRDHEVELKFKARSKKDNWKATISFFVDTEKSGRPCFS